MTQPGPDSSRAMRLHSLTAFLLSARSVACASNRMCRVVSRRCFPIQPMRGPDSHDSIVIHRPHVAHNTLLLHTRCRRRGMGSFSLWRPAAADARPRHHHPIDAREVWPKSRQLRILKIPATKHTAILRHCTWLSYIHHRTALVTSGAAVVSFSSLATSALAAARSASRALLARVLLCTRCCATILGTAK